MDLRTGCRWCHGQVEAACPFLKVREFQVRRGTQRCLHVSTPPRDRTSDLDRFKLAQDLHGSFDAAIAELDAGRKTTHWVWWVFPQVAGLGTSATSARYALAGRDEACAYLADEVLRSRLAQAMEAVHGQLVGPRRGEVDRVMGSEIDAVKLVSSMTLFAEVGRDPAVRDLPGVNTLVTLAAEILETARGSGYPACERTRTILSSGL